MIKKTILALTVVLASTFAVAETYNLDTAASSVLWKGGKKVGSFHNGGISAKSGSIEVDEKGKVKSINVVVDMKTITNEDLKESPEYQAKLVGHLSNEDFFNVQKYPESVFQSTSVVAKAGAADTYVVKGKLTMIGQTRPVSFDAKISTDKTGAAGQATLVVKRLNWGLQYGSGSIFKSLTADKIINDTFELQLNLKAKK